MLAKSTSLRWGLALMLLLTTSITFAQRVVTGKVTDPNNQPAAGATVTVTGTNVATQTDAEGNFTINVPQGRNGLTVSYVGAEAQQVSASGSTVSVALRPATSNISEVVVTGYTSQQRKNIVGAVSTVKGEQLAAVQTGNAEQQFQGRIPGVTVITSGQPGTVSQVRIRGFGSFSANAPLYIVDGIPTTNIDFLNGNDIESATVLKDASSASIYGARAAAGVIIMTTKKGSNVLGRYAG